MYYCTIVALREGGGGMGIGQHKREGLIHLFSILMRDSTEALYGSPKV